MQMSPRIRCKLSSSRFITLTFAHHKSVQDHSLGSRPLPSCHTLVVNVQAPEHGNMVTYSHVSTSLHREIWPKIPSPEEPDLLSLFHVSIVCPVLEHLDSRTMRAGVPLSIADTTSASHHAVRNPERCVSSRHHQYAGPTGSLPKIH